MRYAALISGTLVSTCVLVGAVARADTASSAAAFLSTQKCPGDQANQKLAATTAVASGSYAAVGAQCGSAAWIVVLERRGPTWAKLGDTLSGTGSASDPLAIEGVPASAAASLWNQWRRWGSSQNMRPGSSADVATVKQAAVRRDPELKIAKTTVIGAWALLEWNMSEAGGEELWHKVNGTWTRVAGGGGAMDVTLVSAFGAPYAIAQRLVASGGT